MHHEFLERDPTLGGHDLGAVKQLIGKIDGRFHEPPGCGDGGLVVPVVFACASLDHRLMAVSPSGNYFAPPNGAACRGSAALYRVQETILVDSSR